MKQPNKTAKKLTSGIFTIIILSFCLCITTFALVYSVVAVDNNLFETGIIKINLNDGQPVIKEHEFLFEPGVTVEKNFFLKNQGTGDVYYKLYFDQVQGGLADVLDVAIRNKDTGTVLYSGKLSDLTKKNVGVADDILRIKESRNFKITFHFPELEGNQTQNQYVSFDISADAVQTKNNPDRKG